ncbi:MAG: YfhO family protein, partial [Lachnospiraceae bacterium]|nr:YfhO family protein [Candidatus Equihabitans merdae]
MKEKTRLTHINKRMLLTLLLVTGASCLLAFSRFYIFGDRVLVFKDIGSDTAQQYLALYASISEKIRSGDWTLWNVDNGFGVNMYMCNLFNPLLWILYVVGAIFGFSPVPQMLVWWFMLEILLAALCAYVYLSVFDLPEIAKGIAAYIYAFNGFLIVWGQHYQFGIICIILPLLLWSVERYFRDSSKWPLMTIMTAVVVFNSMYLAYMSLLMTGFYVVLRILMHENNRPLKYIRRVVATAIPMFLGVFIGMVSLLPSYIAIKSASNRLDGGMDWGNFLVHMIDRYPNLYFKTALDRLMSSVGEGISLFHGLLNYYEAPALFFSGLFIILLFQYIFSIPVQKVSRKSKILQVVFLVLTAGVMYFINIGTILNGFTAPFCRFTFLLMPYFLLIVAFAMKRILEEKKINLIALLAAALMMAWRGRIILLSDWHNPKKVLLMSFAACGMMVICLGILRFVKKEKSRRIVFIALLLFLFINVSAETYGNFGARDTLLKDDEYFEDVEDPDTLEALAMIQAEDAGLYRIEKMYGASFCVDAMYQNYQGVSTYNSVQNGNIQELVDSDWTQIR